MQWIESDYSMETYGNATAEIAKLRADYCWAYDTKKVQAFASLFAPDGVLDMAQFGGIFTGSEDIEARIRNFMPGGGSAPVTMHCIHTQSIDLISNDAAQGRCYVSVFHLPAEESSLPPRLLGRYVDKYRRTEEGWKFAVAKLETFWLPGERVRQVEFA